MNLSIFLEALKLYLFIIHMSYHLYQQVHSIALKLFFLSSIYSSTITNESILSVTLMMQQAIFSHKTNAKWVHSPCLFDCNKQVKYGIFIFNQFKYVLLIILKNLQIKSKKYFKTIFNFLFLPSCAISPQEL